MPSAAAWSRASARDSVAARRFFRVLTPNPTNDSTIAIKTSTRIAVPAGDSWTSTKALFEIASAGDLVGALDGLVLGLVLGELDGRVLGDLDGLVLGLVLGEVLGAIVGDRVGEVLGDVVGSELVGDRVGGIVGNIEGVKVGDLVGAGTQPPDDVADGLLT